MGSMSKNFVGGMPDFRMVEGWQKFFGRDWQYGKTICRWSAKFGGVTISRGCGGKIILGASLKNVFVGGAVKKATFLGGWDGNTFWWWSGQIFLSGMVKHFGM